MSRPRFYSMANIENRRIKRRFISIGMVAGAALLLCAVVLACILLPKACRAPKREDPAGATEPAQAANTPEPTQQTVTEQPVTQQPVSTPEPALETEKASPEPQQTEAELHQLTEDRSLVLFTLNVDTCYSAEGYARKRIEGGCAVSFVNNTDADMYAAYFDMHGLEVKSASVNGIAVGFYTDDSGRFVLPFSDMLSPGSATELYFEFAGTVSAVETLELPVIDYDTVFDAVCAVQSDSILGFSCGEAEQTQQDQRFIYRLEAEGIRQIALSFTAE